MAREIFPSRPVTVDSNDTKRGTRVWEVERPVDAALADPDLPDLNSPWPAAPDTDMTLDSYSREEVVKGVLTVVTANYSNDGSGNFGQLVPKKYGFQEWTVEYRDTVVSLPAATYSPVKKPGPPGSPVLTKKVWILTERRIVETRPVFTVTVLLNRRINLNDHLAIADEVNKIHTIGGRQYRFAAGTSRQINKKTWELNYSWEMDRGTGVVTGYDVNSLWFPPAVGTGICRFPYVTLHAVAADDPTIQTSEGWPRVKSYNEYTARDTGYLNLPGVGGLS